MAELSEDDDYTLDYKAVVSAAGQRVPEGVHLILEHGTVRVNGEGGATNRVKYCQLDLAFDELVDLIVDVAGRVYEEDQECASEQAYGAALAAARQRVPKSIVIEWTSNRSIWVGRKDKPGCGNCLKWWRYENKNCNELADLIVEYAADVPDTSEDVDVM